MLRCTTSDHVTDTELIKIISCMNKTTCCSDPLSTRLQMSHLQYSYSTAHCKSMFNHVVLIIL